MKKTAVCAALAAAICLALYALRPQEQPPAEVRVASAVPQTIFASVEASGSLEAYRARKLGVAAYAEVDEIYLNVGDSVREGQVILTYKPAENPSADASLGEILESADVGAALSGDLAAAAGGAIADAISSGGELVSPFDGVLTALDIAEGEQISPLAAAAEVSDFSRVRARVRVSEGDFGSIAVGMPAEVTSGGEVFDAVVIEVAPLVRSSTSLTGGSERYGEAVLELYDPTGATPGGSASAKIYTERRSGVITLPFEAIGQDAQNREFVYVDDGGRARLCFVATGEDYGAEVEILSGVESGDLVIVDPPEGLQNGDAVEAKR